MSKVNFIIFSDVQVEDWKRFSTHHSRLGHSLAALERVSKAANDCECPVLFCGDFFDNAKELSNLVISSTFKTYHRNFKGIETFAISGNHDQSESNSITHKSPSHLELYDYALKNFHLLDNDFRDVKVKGRSYRIHGIPYLKDNKGFVDLVKVARRNLAKGKRNILLLHTDFHNISYDNKRKSGTIENLPRRLTKLFKGFDMIFSGHIHKPQLIRSNLLMVGATNHQRVSDLGINMGYWKLYDNLELEFVKLDLPQFKVGEEKGDGHFYIPKPRKIEKVKVGKGESFITEDLDSLARNYLKAKNIEDRRKHKYLKKYLEHGLSQ